MAKKQPKKPAKLSGKKKASASAVEKVLLRRHNGQWVEYAAWHLGPLDTQGPGAHHGWEIINDLPVTQEPWTADYDRWVKMRWTGAGLPFDLG